MYIYMCRYKFIYTDMYVHKLAGCWHYQAVCDWIACRMFCARPLHISHAPMHRLSVSQIICTARMLKTLWWRCDISILLSSTVTGADKSNTCNFDVLRQADHPRCRRSRPPATSHVVLQVQLRRNFRPAVGPPVVRHNHLTSVQQPHLERRLCALLFL